MNADAPTVSSAYSTTFYDKNGLYSLYDKNDLWYHADRHGANFWVFLPTAATKKVGDTMGVWAFSSLSSNGKNTANANFVLQGGNAEALAASVALLLAGATLL